MVPWPDLSRVVGARTFMVGDFLSIFPSEVLREGYLGMPVWRFWTESTER